MKNKPKYKQSSFIPQAASEINTSQQSFLDQDITKLRGNQDPNDSENSNALVSIRFLQHDYQCFSDWDKKQMKEFWRFQDKVFKCTWHQLKTHSGLRIKEIPIIKYKKFKFSKELSLEISIFELRVNKRMRVHGFRNNSVFYVCWLDKDHKICPD